MRTWRVAILIVAGAGLILLIATGTLAEVADVDRIERGVERAGVLGPVLFIGAVVGFNYTLLGGPIVWASTLMFSDWQAVLWSEIAVIGSAFLNYEIIRRGGADGIRSRIPPRVLARETMLTARPLTSVAVLRTMLWINPYADAVIAVARVPPRAHAVSTLAVLVPLTVLNVLAAGAIFDVFR